MITVYVFNTKPEKAPSVPKPKAIENNPLIRFGYPSDHWQGERLVRLISANAKYFWGLEIRKNPDTGKLKYMPKRFTRAKSFNLQLVEFNTPSMPK
jgi:hypothetical protein